MKLIKIQFCAALLGAAMFANNVATAAPGYLNISGTATTDTSISTGRKVTTFSFKTKDVLAFLAQATGELWISNKNSHLVYDPTLYNAAASSWYTNDVYGIFWITNTANGSGSNYFRLDSTNTSSYWSYIELDYYPYWGRGPLNTLGFWKPDALMPSPFATSLGIIAVDNYVEISSTNSSKFAGKELGSDAILYVHDYPYANDFDYPDHGRYALYDSNNNGIVIRGPINLNWSHTSSKKTESLTIKGSGDGLIYNSGLGEYFYPVISGKVTWSGKGPGSP